MSKALPLCIIALLWAAGATAQTQTGEPSAGEAQPSEDAQPVAPQAAPRPRASDQDADSAPNVAAREAASAAQGPADPFIPVDDPMLDPPEPPPKIVPSWQEALQTVRTRSPDLVAAYAQIQVAKGRARQTLARSLPNLVANGRLNHFVLQGDVGTAFNCPGQAVVSMVRLPCPRGNFTADVTLRVPLISARSWYDYGTAKKEIQRAQYQSEDVERLIIAGLAESILQVVTNERLAEVTRVNLAAALSTLELNRKRARLGAADAVDILRAEQEVATSRSQVIQADENLRQARERLGLALGYPEAYGVPPGISLDQLRADARATCQQGESIDDRPDIQAARTSRQIAERNVDSVDFEFLPTVDGTSTVSYNYNEQATATRQHGTWTIGATITWNLYDGGLRYGEKQTNQGLLASTTQDTLDAERNAQVQVKQAFRGVQVAQDRLAVAQQSLEIATDNARLARVKFVHGTGSSFDMVQTQSAARQAALDVTVREFELLQAQITAFLALASCDI